MALLAACGGAPPRDEGPRPAAAPELAQLEARSTIDGRALPPRADAPRTVVVFFASW